MENVCAIMAGTIPEKPKKKNKGKENNKAKKDPKTEHLAKTRKRSDA